MISDEEVLTRQEKKALSILNSVLLNLKYISSHAPTSGLRYHINVCISEIKNAQYYRKALKDKGTKMALHLFRHPNPTSVDGVLRQFEEVLTRDQDATVQLWKSDLGFLLARVKLEHETNLETIRFLKES